MVKMKNLKIIRSYAFIVIAMIQIGYILVGCSDENILNCDHSTMAKRKTTRSVEINTRYMYPSITEIMESSDVCSMMENVWSRTLAAASSAGRKEFGFYIYYNYMSGVISCGNVIEGPLVTSAQESGSIDLGEPKHQTNTVAAQPSIHIRLYTI